MDKVNDEIYFKNLMCLRKYLEDNKKVIQPKLNMKYYTQFDQPTSACNSFGCIIGHAVSIPELSDYISLRHTGIDYPKFTEEAFNVGANSYAWLRLFGPSNPNSISGFIKRLDAHLAKVYPQFIKD